ncbi:methionyl-tRNA formyltransferase [bacterium]|nr:methionyl-tRNA formyltransferase [bacterium]
MKLKIAFFGTDIFAEIILSYIISCGFNLDFVVTMPDCRIGKDKELKESKVSKLANKNNIKCLKLKSFSELYNYSDIDLFIVAEYGKIIPKKVLDIPKLGSFNIHGSILPKYRGASPIQESLKNGDLETGISIIKMDEKMDHGDVVGIGRKNSPVPAKIKIDKYDNQLILRKKLANQAGLDIVSFLKKIENNEKLTFYPQNHKEATYCSIIKREDGFCDFSLESSQDIINKYRAYYNWPGIFTIIKNKRIKLNEIDLDSYIFDDSFKKIDENFYKKNKDLYIRCFDSKMIKVLKIQKEGKKEISGREFQL